MAGSIPNVLKISGPEDPIKPAAEAERKILFFSPKKIKNKSNILNFGSLKFRDFLDCFFFQFY